LAEADIVIFMNKDVYDEAQTHFRVDARKSLLWHVPDISNEVRRRYDATKDVGTVLDIAERTFQKIKGYCDELQTYVTAGNWVDVVDKVDRPTGLRLPINWVTDRGFWHRGVHVVVQTADGKFVVGKRDQAMIFAPGMLEITLGGLIDSGESPLQAAIRETHEEIGTVLAVKKFRPLFRYQQVGYHPHTHKQTRAHIYVYAVTLPLHSARLVPQPGEVAELRMLTHRQVKHLLHTHRMQHFGHLKYGYQLYRRAVAYSTLPY
jgi:8-oxo-dGTP pyrophosphatase MutT (NUDIX family)